MLSVVLANVFLVAQLFGMPGTPSPAATPANAPAAQVAETPASHTDTAKSQPDNLADAFDRWTIGQLFKGKKKLSPEELGHVEFWASLVKEPLLAAIGFVPRLFVAAIFIVLFWGIHRGLRKLVLASLGKSNVDPSIRDMLGHLIKWCVMGFGMVIAFNQIGIQITALLTGVSIIGLAMGLAAQDTLANFIAGIVIFWDKPFRIGQTIAMDEVCGTVQRVTFRSTRLLTADGELVVFPNTYVLARKLINHSAHPVGRVSVPVGIAQRASIDDARAVLLALPIGDHRICDDPAPNVVVSECADGKVKLLLRLWVRNKASSGMLLAEYLEKSKKALDVAGIVSGAPTTQLVLDPSFNTSRDLRAAG